MTLVPAHVDLWSQQALVLAQLGEVRWHRHAAAALLIGLNGTFSVRWDRRWRRAQAAFLPAGVSHALACGQTLMGVVYLFPMTGDVEGLQARLRLPLARPRVLVSIPDSVREGLLAIHGGDGDAAWTQAWLRDQVLGQPAPARGDRRVREVLEQLQRRPSDARSVEALAESLGLSASRLMHLFKGEVGVPIRRYRIWERVRLLTQHVAAGDSLTMAGLAAGFSDSAHLSHSFQSMFGIPTSQILNPQSRLRV